MSRATSFVCLASFACALSNISLQPLSGATIPIFSTGVDNSGQSLAPGATDSHYVLTLNDLNGGTNSYVALGADSTESGYYLIPQGWPQNVQFGWASTAIMSGKWISPQADVVGIPGVPENTYYVYQTTFDLTGLDPTTADLQGIWAADNYVTQVLLNGTPVYTNSSVQSVDCFSFQNPTPFDINSGFTTGVNTLSFYVTNDTCHNDPPATNPTGLLVDFGLATADPASNVPEPATMLLTGIGLAFAAGFARRRG